VGITKTCKTRVRLYLDKKEEEGKGNPKMKLSKEVG
jgi:hypothetical protein